MFIFTTTAFGLWWGDKQGGVPCRIINIITYGVQMSSELVLIVPYTVILLLHAPRDLLEMIWYVSYPELEQASTTRSMRTRPCGWHKREREAYTDSMAVLVPLAGDYHGTSKFTLIIHEP